MRAAEIFYKGELAGILKQLDDGSFHFVYIHEWLLDSSKPEISLTLPKSMLEFTSKTLFPFFYHMLPEGVNRDSVCLLNRLAPEDDFGVLLATAEEDTVGAVSVKEIKR